MTTAGKGKRDVLKELGHVEPIFVGPSHNDCSLAKSLAIVLVAGGVAYLVNTFVDQGPPV